MNHQPTLGFIGAGKVGHTLARLWYSKGYSVSAVYSRSQDHATELASFVGAWVAGSPGEVANSADLTFLTVPDSVIADITSKIGNIDGRKQKAVVHTSGASDKSVLSPLAAQGLMTGSLHPVFPFADVATAIQQIPGATFGVEADSPVLYQWLQVLVLSVSGHVLLIPDDGKILYHSAFVFASNYVVTLYAIAERVLKGLGAEDAAIHGALSVLLGGTVENIRRMGIPDALTGPLVRGDTDTIKAHLDELTKMDNELAELYTQLGRLSLPMLNERNIDTSFIEPLLNREDHASDNS